MLVFDEEKYARDIYQGSYKTTRYQGMEKAILVRYLNSLGYTKEQILEILVNKEVFDKKYLNKDLIESMCRRLINKALTYEFISHRDTYITNCQIDFIQNISTDGLRRLTFVYTAYYEWAKNIKSLSLTDKKSENPWVIENDVDCFKIARLVHDRMAYKNSMIRKMIDLGIYESKIVNGKYMYRMVFPNNDYHRIAVIISNYDDILKYWEYINDEYKLCEKCNIPMKPNSNVQKYCSKCAKIAKKEQNEESRKRCNN